jgi:hypothetical protein
MVTHRVWSVAVEVGFEPTEDLRLHTLSSTAHHRSPASASVRDLREHDQMTTGERWRTGVNETKTEPTAWSRRAAADRPGIAGQRPVICRREPVSAEPGSGWAIVGNQQDLSDGYEAGSLVITDSDCMADCGPSLIAPAEYALPADGDFTATEKDRTVNSEWPC